MEIFLSKVIAITNQKGGVGKTTTCINLASSLCAMKRRVLLVDLDPQGNATTGSGISIQIENSINEILLNKIDVISEIVIETKIGYDLIPSDESLTVSSIQLLKEEKKQYRLRDKIKPIRFDYDFILFDCPPSLNILTINALIASDSVLIPVQCEYYSLEGLSGLLKTIRKLIKVANENLAIEGILRTMYDGRNKLTHEVSKELTKSFSDMLFNTVIPRNVRLAEAPSHGLPALLYDKHSQGAVAYLALAGEIIRRQKQSMKTSTN